jgi:putative peptidoglycan lipid II flippase
MATDQGRYRLDVPSEDETGRRSGRFTRRSATFIGSFTLAARIVERLGAFGQIALIASIYGSSFLADRFFIASIVPLIIGAIMGEALSANVMPALVRGETDRVELIGAGLWLSTALLATATAVYVVVATVVVQDAAPTGSSDPRVWYVFAPVGLFLGLGGYLSGVLTYLERYVWPPFRSAISTVAGLALTVLAVAFTRDLVWVAAAVTTGYGVSLLALLLETRRIVGRGALARPSRQALGAALSLRRGLAAPVLGGILGGQVFVLLERVLASTLAVGAVSTLAYARGLVFTPAIVAQSIALGLYPGMVRAFEAQELGHVRESFIRGLRLTLFLGLALAIFFATFGQDTVSVLLERGEFSAGDVRAAGTALAAFSPALVGTMLMVLLARVYYAVAYFRAVVWVQLIALALYAAVALPFRSSWGTSGLALAFGVAEGTGAACGLAIAARRVGLGRRRLVAEAVVPAVVRVLPLGAAVGGLALVVHYFASGASPLLHVVVALVAVVLIGGMLLWSSTWPELVPLKRGLSRLARLSSA